MTMDAFRRWAVARARRILPVKMTLTEMASRGVTLCVQCSKAECPSAVRLCYRCHVEVYEGRETSPVQTAPTTQLDLFGVTT